METCDVKSKHLMLIGNLKEEFGGTPIQVEKFGNRSEEGKVLGLE